MHRLSLSRQLSTHDYTTFGSLPSRKRKAPHSLQECVYRNTGLGQTKHAKDWQEEQTYMLHALHVL